MKTIYLDYQAATPIDPRVAAVIMSAMTSDFGAELLTACFLAVYASHPPVTRRMATLATGLPATALTGLDLHQLDFNKRFH